MAIKNLGWEKIKCEIVTFPEDEVLSYIIHHNKQRIKRCREQLNEVKVLMEQHKIGQGKRADMSTCVKIGTSSKKNQRCSC